MEGVVLSRVGFLRYFFFCKQGQGFRTLVAPLYAKYIRKLYLHIWICRVANAASISE